NKLIHMIGSGSKSGFIYIRRVVVSLVCVTSARFRDGRDTVKPLRNAATLIFMRSIPQLITPHRISQRQWASQPMSKPVDQPAFGSATGCAGPSFAFYRDVNVKAKE